MPKDPGQKRAAESQSSKFVDVAVNTKSSKIDDLFTYSVPKEVEGDIVIGQLVLIPLVNRVVNGIVIKKHNKKPHFSTKNIVKIVDPEPIVSEAHIELAKFISQHYWCPFSLALFHMLPPNLRKRQRKLQITNHKSQENSKFKIPNFKLELTEAQKKAFGKIEKTIGSKKHKTFLLHGVTGSGKTEIYLRAFAHVLKKGKQGIYIVPEIALTPQSINVFKKVFGEDRIAVIHSKLAIGQRLQTWLDIKEGKKDIIIGSRSAIFAPCDDLGMIVIDEEHDLISFKSDQTPRYELHLVAEKLAELTESVLIFGSATPLVTSYYRALGGYWEYLSLPERINHQELPKIKIVDMNEDKMKGNDDPIFSEYILQGLAMVLKNKRQALLFLNRRGMATSMRCGDCGEIMLCDDCESALIYHLINKKLWCHHCSKTYNINMQCRKCRGYNMKFLGQGTERIEKDITRLFPTARVARMDRDTMESDQDYTNIFGRFRAGDIDILIGTQMIVHGWDIPSVDLAGVVNLDLALNMPDYRSGETAFQLITQLAGRTGRGLARLDSPSLADARRVKGMLVLQTEIPDHWILQLAEKNSYIGFVKRELEMREKFGYPPFVQLIKLSFSHRDRELAERRAIKLAELLKSKCHPPAGGSNVKSSSKSKETTNTEYLIHNTEVIGPLEPIVAKKYGKWIQSIIIKTKGHRNRSQSETDESWDKTEELLKLVPKDWTIDVDPLSML